MELRGWNSIPFHPGSALEIEGPVKFVHTGKATQNTLHVWIEIQEARSITV